MTKKTQITQSEKEGRNVVLQLLDLLKSGSKVRAGVVTDELNTKGGKRFTIYTEDKKNDK